MPVKFELRQVSAAGPAETAEPRKVTMQMVFAFGSTSFKPERDSTLTGTNGVDFLHAEVEDLPGGEAPGRVLK